MRLSNLTAPRSADPRLWTPVRVQLSYLRLEVWNGELESETGHHVDLDSVPPMQALQAVTPVPCTVAQTHTSGLTLGLHAALHRAGAGKFFPFQF